MVKRLQQVMRVNVPGAGLPSVRAAGTRQRNSMVRLTTIKPRLKSPPSRLQPSRAGDVRIRGSALQTIRERILRRDGGICRCDRCKASGDVKLATIVDHRIPLWMGGREDDDNRQAINEDCHNLKSAEEAKLRARGG